MANELPADQALTVEMARLVLDGIGRQEDDTRLANELVSSLGDYADKLIPEDRRRFADQISIFPEFMATYRAFDQACAEGKRDLAAEHMTKIQRLSEESKLAMRYRGLTDAAEALAKATDFADFCAVLPSVAFDRTYGSGFHGTSPFPLIWALSARSRPLERVQLMIEAGARTDLQTRLGDTVLHAMARMRRKGKVRLPILKMLISAGADLQCQNIHRMTPLAVALADGSDEDVEYFLQAGARVDQIELRCAAEDPARLALVLAHIDGDPRFDELAARLGDWLTEETMRAQQHLDEAIEQDAGIVAFAERVERLTTSLEAVNSLH